MNLVICLLIVLLFSPILWAQEPVKMAYPSTSYTTMPIVVALREGFLNKEGLSLELILAYPFNGTTSLEVLRKDLEIARQLGGIQADVSLSRVMDFRLLREVQKELGIQE